MRHLVKAGTPVDLAVRMASAASIILLLSGCAHWEKPGGTQADRDRAVAYCKVVTANQVPAPQPPPQNPPATSKAEAQNQTAGALQGLSDQINYINIQNATFDSCMYESGWSRVRNASAVSQRTSSEPNEASPSRSPTITNGSTDSADPIAQARAALHDKDYTTAFRLLYPLAEKGHVGAQSIIAMLYFNGQGVEKNIPASFVWYLQAAKHGNVRSQSAVGEMYWYGWGTPQNTFESYKWLCVAASRLSPAENDLRDPLYKLRDQIALKLAPGEIDVAQKWIGEWKPEAP